MQKSSAQLMLIVLVVGLLLMRESRQNPGAAIESGYVDWLAANTERTAPPAPLVLVEINNSSLVEKHPWPWSPLDFTLFLQAILQFDPSVAAIEHVLEWDGKSLPPEEKLKLPQYQKILHDYLLRSPKILLAAQLGVPEDPDIIPPMQPVPMLRHIQGDRKAIPEFTIVEHQPNEELRLAATLGFTNLPAGKAIARSVPLLFRYRGEVVPSFVLQAMMLWFQLTPDDIKVDVGTSIAMGDKVSIPIDDAGNMRVDFKSPYTSFGFDDLLLAVELTQANHRAAITPKKVRNRLALLARTDRASHTLSFPTGRKGSSGELYAAAIATIQTKSFIHRISPVFDLCLLASLMALSWCFLRWDKSRVLAVSGVVLVIYLLGSITVFGASLIWLPIVMPGGTMLFLVLFRWFAPKVIQTQQSSAPASL